MEGSEKKAVKEGSENNSAKKGDFEKLREVMGLLNDPSTGFLQMFEKMKVDCKSEIRETTPGNGFLELNADMDFSQGSCQLSQLPKLFDLWLEGANIPQDCMKKIEVMLKEASIQDWTDPFLKNNAKIAFKSGAGSYHILVVEIFPKENPERNGVRYKKLLYQTSFRVAPSYMIVRETYSDILYSETEDHIVYLPAAITEDHIRSLKTIGCMITCSAFDQEGQLIGEFKQIGEK